MKKELHWRQKKIPGWVHGFSVVGNMAVQQGTCCGGTCNLPEMIAYVMGNYSYSSSLYFPYFIYSQRFLAI
jgi:hypothetical protein